MMNRIRELFVLAKVYQRRTMSYVGMINSSMILFIFLAQIEQYGIEIDMQKWLVPIVILSLAFLVLVGWLEDALGFYKEEQKISQDRSPYFPQILERLDKIEARLHEERH